MAKLNYPHEYLEKYLKKYLNYLDHHPSNWIYGYHNQIIIENIQVAYKNLTQTLIDQSIYHSPRILIAEPDPIKFISLFLAACATNSQIFLSNPHWGKNEWIQALQLSQPDLIIGDDPPLSQISLRIYNLPLTTSFVQTSPQIMIPTGGTSGRIKFAVHTWATLSASVSGFLQHFQLQTANFICTLPLYHVSGLMQLMRTLLTGGKLAIYDFPQLETVTVPPIDSTDFLISLVPTQLHRLFQNPGIIPWLSKMQAVLLGGAPSNHDLLDQARLYNIPIALTYGMTETASQVATLLPEQFLNGANHCGQVLPHTQISIVDEHGNLLPQQSIGKIQIKSTSLALGYYGQTVIENNFHNDYFQPDDNGFFDADLNLHLLGRSSDKIITGGENVFPDEVEAAIRDTGLVLDIKIIGIPHRQWGEAVTAIYVPQRSTIDDLPKLITLKLKSQLSKFKIPKYWIPLTAIPYNPQGKINRQLLQQIAIDYLSAHVSSDRNPTP